MASEPPAALKRQIVVTIGALVIHATLVLLSGFVLVLLTMGSDACGRQLWCERPWLGPGLIVGFGAGTALFILATVISIVRLRGQSPSLRVPLVGCGTQVVLFGIGAVLVMQPATPA
ncbi:hypothetical protein [Mycolicibacterium hippocampi]|uniref:hypothetical protein n=1 Tax=Mycolicibacterium hippocampi TaxID=659824 RepID=UPI0035636D6D